MKLKTPTVLLVGVAAVLGVAAIAALQDGDRTSEGAQPLFSFAEEDVEALSIEAPLGSLDLEQDEADTWQLKEPQQAPVNEATVTFLLDLLATEESDRTFSVPVEELADYALANPQATIEIELEDGTRHELVLGDYDFSNESLYAQVDPPEISDSDGAEEVEVRLIPAAFESAINRPLQDWIQLETESPEGDSEDTLTQPELSPEDENRQLDPDSSSDSEN